MKRKAFVAVPVALAISFCLAGPLRANPSSPNGQPQASFAIGGTSYMQSGEPHPMDAAPFIADGRTFVPVRYLAVALGVSPDQIHWYPDTQQVTLATDGVRLTLTIGVKTVSLNGQLVQLDVAPVIQNGHTYLPARFVAEALGYRVRWDASTQRVIVETPSGPYIPTQRAGWVWERSSSNPVLAPEQVPARAGALYPLAADPTALFEDGKFKLWFGYGGFDDVSDTNNARVRVGYAESPDGLSWQVTAPVLDVGAPTAWDRTNAETPSVVRDDSLPDGHPRKYRLYYAGLDHAVEQLPLEKLLQAGMAYGIGVAFSADGKHFTRLPALESPYGAEGLVLKPNPPVVDQDVYDFLSVADPHVLIKDGHYYMWYTSGIHQAGSTQTSLGIALATSDDGIHWVKQGLVMQGVLPWETARPEVSVGRPYVLWTGQRFEMFYDAVRDDDNPLKNSAMGIGFAWSADGKVWTREPDPVFLSTNGPGEKKGVIIGSAVLLKDGTYYLFYPGADPDWSRFSINLAIARLVRP